MRLFQPLAFVLLALVLVSTGWCRIGETLKQSTARYGNPLYESEQVEGVQGAERYEFLKAGIHVVLTFVDNKAVEIIYWKSNADSFSSVELNALCEANAGSSTWNFRGVKDFTGSTTYTTYCGTKEARLQERGVAPNISSDALLQISTSEWLLTKAKARETHHNKVSRQRLLGF